MVVPRLSRCGDLQPGFGSKERTCPRGSPRCQGQSSQAPSLSTGSWLALTSCLLPVFLPVLVRVGPTAFTHESTSAEPCSCHGLFLILCGCPWSVGGPFNLEASPSHRPQNPLYPAGERVCRQDTPNFSPVVAWKCHCDFSLAIRMVTPGHQVEM